MTSGTSGVRFSTRVMSRARASRSPSSIRLTRSMATQFGGGLRPLSAASPWDAVRAAGRRGAGAPPSEASNPELAPAKSALERRSHSSPTRPSVLSQKLVDKAPGWAEGPTAEHAESQPAPGTRKEPRERGFRLRQRAEATVPRWAPPPRPAPRVNRFLGHHTRRNEVGGGPARGDSNRFA